MTTVAPPTHARRTRLRGGLRRVPVPLAAVLLVAFAFSLTWALVEPPWQSPDEQVHFAYAQELASDGALPGNAHKQTFSTDQGLALQATDLNGVALHAQVPAVWDPALVRAWKAQQARLPASQRHDGGGPNSAEPNPPLYYALLAPPYWLASATGGTVIDHMYGMRVWSGLLLLLTVTATWLLAGELFGRRRLLQTAAAGIVALQPETTFLTSMTNPDALLIALWTVGTWLGVRVLRRGLTLRGGVALGLVGAAAVLTKATGYALLLTVLLVFLVSGVRLWRRGAGNWRRTVVACLLALVVPVGGWLIVARVTNRPAVNSATTVGAAVNPLNMNYDDFAHYVRNFYAPDWSLSSIDHSSAASLWIAGAWGRFGFVDVNLPANVVGILRALSLLAVVGGLVGLIRLARRRSGFDPWIPIFLVVVCVLLLAALHYADFQQIASAAAAGQPPPAFMQGRYLLPIVGVLACFATAGLTLVPRRVRAPAVGLVLGGMWCLQLLSLGLVMERYFA